MKFYLTSFSILTWIWLGINPLCLYAKTDDDQHFKRALFIKAENAINSKSDKQAEKLQKQLQDYPLYPYLVYKNLRLKLSALPETQVNHFIKTYQNTPLATRLYLLWLNTLAKKEKWAQYISSYNHELSHLHTAKYQCDFAFAQIKTGDINAAFSSIPALWIKSTSQPRSCDKLFSYWINHKGITHQHVWARLKLAMDARERSLISYLEGFLPEQEQSLVALWLKVDKQPDIIQDKNYFTREHPFMLDILTQGIMRMIEINENKAVDYWNKIRSDYAFTQEQINKISNKIALMMAIRNNKNAVKWFSSIPEAHTTQTMREWRIRNRLINRDWKQVIYWITLLPDDEESAPIWQYWKARAFTILEQTKLAEPIYTQLARERHYYGFLASEMLDVPYSMANQSYPSRDNMLSEILMIPGIQRAYELYQLKRFSAARVEWKYAIKSLTNEQRQAAAYLAFNWGWYDRAIITAVNQTHMQNDLTIRFPLANEDIMLTAAALNNLDPALTFAIARQESLFINDARSQVGALGIMQLMPKTAYLIAKESNRAYKGKHQLLNPDINIHLGTAYLKKLHNLYYHNTVLATAAYNAGPNRVKTWVPKNTSLPADIWIDTIPYHETRDYLKNVLAYTVIYDHKLGNPSSLKQRMQQIGFLKLAQ